MLRLNKKALLAEAERNRFAIKWSGILGFVAHPLYFLVWTYVLPQPYDHLGLRLSAALFCLPLIFQQVWPKRFAHGLVIYWHFCLVYALPFVCTFLTVKNGFSTMWMMTEVMMIFIMALCIEYAALLVIYFTIGVSAGFLAAAWASSAPLVLTVTDHANLALLPIVLICSTACSESIKKGRLVAARNTALTALAGSIAHELRNPLAQVKFSLESVQRKLPLSEGGAPPKALAAQDVHGIQDHLAQGLRAVDQGQQVIAMTLNEVSARPLDRSQFRPLSAAAVTHRAVADYCFASARERERVRVVVRQDFVFQGDEIAYLFVLFNLIQNALYYFAGHPAAALDITVEAGCVRVRDTGPGIAPEALPYLFSAFHTEGKAQGTGLGLAYCKRTLEAFGGEIRCASELGAYTEFTLHLPVLSGQEYPMPMGSSVDRAEEGQHPPVGSPTRVADDDAVLAGRTVLLVEDSEINRTMLRRMLEGEGLQVLEAEHGRMALDICQTSGTGIHLVLMDMHMPGWDGLQTTRALRALPAMAQVPVLALTGHVDEAVQAQARAAGMNECLEKTLGWEGLLRRLRGYLGADAVASGA